MAVVRELISIDAPYVQAVGPFERRLGLDRGAKEGRCSFVLVAPLLPGRDLARTVEARTARIDSGNYTSRYAIEWDEGKTATGIPTPGFAGTLTLRAGEDYPVSDVVLEGTYRVPGGPLGALFDELAGRRIAHATLAALLDGISREIEEAHREMEARKHHTPAD